MKGKNIRKGITSVAILSLVLCLMSTGVMHAEDDETVFTPVSYTHLPWESGCRMIHLYCV